MEGKETFFSIGTDEHGIKIQKKAQEQGVAVQDFCKRNTAKFKELFSKGAVGYDDFVKTTERRHKTAVEEFWVRLTEAGRIG